MGHPAIRAVMPVCSVWDTWGDMFYPGGLLFIGMLGGYGRLIEALDLDQREALRDFPYFSSPSLAGPAPVDEDNGALLTQAIGEHAANFDMTDFITQLGLRGAALRHDPNFTTATIAPKTYAAGIPTGLPHYGVSGWMDGAGYTAGAISRFHALPNAVKRLLLGPWDHGARTHVSPGRKSARPGFEMLAEILRHFDEHVAERPTGLAQEQSVHYFTMIEEAWHAADTFPPTGTVMQSWVLGPNRNLLDSTATLASGADEYRVDHGLGSGRNTRYERIAGQPVEEYYPDWHGRDARMAHWTSPPFAAPIEVTGTPVADLWITADTPDAAIIAYLGRCGAGRANKITSPRARCAPDCRAVAPDRWPITRTPAPTIPARSRPKVTWSPASRRASRSRCFRPRGWSAPATGCDSRLPARTATTWRGYRSARRRCYEFFAEGRTLQSFTCRLCPALSDITPERHSRISGIPVSTPCFQIDAMRGRPKHLPQRNVEMRPGMPAVAVARTPFSARRDRARQTIRCASPQSAGWLATP